MPRPNIPDIENLPREKFLNALAEAYILQDAILGATELSIVSTNAEGIITSFNNGASKLLGYDSQEVIGQATPAIFHDHDEIVQRAQELSEKLGRPIQPGFETFVAKAKHIRNTDRSEWTYIKKNGERIPVLVSISEIRNENNELTGYLGIATDITEQKASEKQLREQYKQLNEFAHIISHNLRSPVGNIGALIGLLSPASSLEDYQLIFDKLKLTSQSLQDTLNDLMETLRIKQESFTERTSVSFEDAFDKVKSDLAGEVIRSKASITHNFKDCPSLVYTKAYIESIFLNLLSNALKYRSPNRPPKIHFETKYVDNKPQLIVSDNGLGIDLEKYGHTLFGFRKVFHEHKEARGVGLFLTKTQVEAMGGKIWVTSAVDNGSNFYIQF